MLRPRGLTRSRCPPEPPAGQGLLPPPPPPPDAPLVSFSPPFSHFYFYFGFFLSLHPCSHHHCSALLPAGALHLLSLLPSLSSLPFSLQLEATPHPFIPAHPSAPQQVSGTGEGQALLEGTVPHPSGHLQSCPQFGGPLVTARGVPSLFAAPRTDPHLWNGALGNTDSSSGSLGRLFAPHQGGLQVFWDIPPWARIPAGADAARSPSGRANKALSLRVPASSPLFVEVSRPSLYGGGGRTPLKDPYSAPGGG